MNILIVGGAGYVGGFLVDTLKKTTNRIRIIDNLLYDDYYFKNVDFYNVNILDFKKVNSHLAWADCVIWLAALVGDPACALNPSLSLDTNVNSVKNLVQNFNKKIIFISTCSVYGAQKGILTESHPTNPLSLYAESKIEAENIIKDSQNPFVIFRLGTLFGMSNENSRLRADLVVNILTIRAYLEKELTIFGGNQFRPLLHVRDVTSAILKSVNENFSGIFNLHLENFTISQIANRVKNFIPEVKINIENINFQDARDYQVSSKLAIETFGFSPKYSIEDGIKEIIEVLKRGRIRDINNPRFSNAIALKDIHGIN